VVLLAVGSDFGIKKPLSPPFGEYVFLLLTAIITIDNLNYWLGVNDQAVKGFR
jgi:hypothetical protein